MKATRDSYGETLVELGKKYENLVVLDADLAGATKTVGFKNTYPDRFFDMGIAEQDLMGTIEAGKFADMVVIDRDIFEIPEDEIKDIQALNTYMAGRETYRRA